MNTVDPLVRVSLAYIVNTHNLFNNYQESCIECALTECFPISTVCLCGDFTHRPSVPSRAMMHSFSGKVTLPFVCSVKMLGLIQTKSGVAAMSCRVGAWERHSMACLCDAEPLSRESHVFSVYSVFFSQQSAYSGVCQ